MCSRIECERCRKPSFVGCGMHVEQVLRDVPPAERCHCREQAREVDANQRRRLRDSLRAFGRRT